MKAEKQEAWFWLFAAGYFAAGVFYYPLFSELNRWTGGFFECSLLKRTGWPCAFCGGSRAAFYFVTGQWNTSWHYHAGVFLLSVSVLVQAVLLLLSSFLKKPENPWLVKRVWFWVVMAAFFLLQWRFHLSHPESLMP